MEFWYGTSTIKIVIWGKKEFSKSDLQERKKKFLPVIDLSTLFTIGERYFFVSSKFEKKI